MEKNILFYSNFCNHSKELIRKISQTKIKETLLYICVDDKNIQIPQFINVVPTIYLVNNKSTLTNNDINEWLNRDNNNKDESILAYNGDSMGSLSTNFSFLDDSDALVSKQYTFLNETDKINTPKDLNNDGQKDSKLSKDFERLQSMRNNDSFNSGIKRV